MVQYRHPNISKRHIRGPAIRCRDMLCGLLRHAITVECMKRREIIFVDSRDAKVLARDLVVDIITPLPPSSSQGTRTTLRPRISTISNHIRIRLLVARSKAHQLHYHPIPNIQDASQESNHCCAEGQGVVVDSRTRIIQSKFAFRSNHHDVA